ncbi:Ig-like domain-containing protein [Paenibacillus sepulcri]|uniref:Ig-like domain-containing protein n=1 Tax=Paenibacillus sepulcri TaxID=359917 RepID=UPI003614B4C3
MPVGSGVSSDSDFTFVFDRSVHLGNGNIQIISLDNNNLNQNISILSGHSTGGMISLSGNTVLLNPDYNLTGRYYVQISEGAFEDLSGNPFAGIYDATTWSFTTWDQSPGLLTFSPDTSGAATDTDLTLFFDEPVILGEGTIVIHRMADDSVAQTFSITSGQMTHASFSGAPGISGSYAIIINPDVNLSGDTSYYVDVPSGTFTDLNHNPFSGLLGQIWSFGTTDDQAPTAVSFSPSGDSAIFPGELTITFNENVQLGTGSIQLFQQGEDTALENVWVSGGSVLSGTASVSPHDPASLDFFHYPYLLQDTSYYVQISSGAIVDTTGNPFAGIYDTTTWSFSTWNSQPSLWMFSPDTSGAATDTNLSLFFNEPVILGEGNIVIHRMDDDSVAQTFSITSGQMTHASFSGAPGISGSYQLIINPDVNLSGDTTYYVEISSGAFTDLNHNPFSGLPGQNWSFGTTDDQAPAAVSFSPSGDDAVFPGEFTITFNENVQLGTGTIQLFRQGDPSPLDTIWVSGGAAPSDMASVSPHDPASINLFRHLDYLDQDTSYYVQISSGAIVDTTGNPFAGIYDATTWRFTTWDQSPGLLTFSPDTSGAAVDTNLSLFFNEPVILGEGNIVIHRMDDDSVAQTFSITSGQMTHASFSGAPGISGSYAFIINPDVNLSGDTSYYVEISSGAFTDLSHNLFSGLHSQNWSFGTTDDQAPAAVSFSPSGDDAVFPGEFTITFNENVQLGTGSIQLFRQGDSSPLDTIWVSGGAAPSDMASVSPHDPASIILFQHLDYLNQDTSYYVQISSGAIVDETGNPFAGIYDTTTWSFTTWDAQPSLWTFSPDTSGAAVDTDLTLFFDEPVILGEGTIVIHRMADDSVAQTFSITSGQMTHAAFSGVTSISGSYQLIINPDVNLSGDTTYYVEISSGAFTDLNHNPFSGLPGQNWSFGTTDDQAPAAVSFSPSGDDAVFPGEFTITFNENVQWGTGTIQLFRQDDDTPLDTIWVSGGAAPSGMASISPYDPASINLFRHLDYLDQDTSYYVQISSGAIVDETGNPFAGIYDTTTWRFTTWDQSPGLLTFSPDTSGAATDTNLSLFFNEPVILGEGNIVIHRMDDDSVAQTFSITSGQMTHASFSGAPGISGSYAIIINPDVNLSGDTSYYVDVPSGAFTDLNHNPFSGLLGQNWSFGTTDDQAPAAVSFSPSGDETVFAGNFGPLTITFNEYIKLGTGSIQLFQQGEDTALETVWVSGGSVLSGTASVSPHDPASLDLFHYPYLLQDTSYYVQISSGAIVDETGNPFAGIYDTTTWSFTTWDAQPSLWMFSPDTSGAAVDTDLTLFFDEPVILGEGNIVIHRMVDDSVAQTFSITSGQMTHASFSGATGISGSYQLIINPDVNLSGDTSYYVEISSGAFTDLSHNLFSGLHGQNWSFGTTNANTIPDNNPNNPNPSNPTNQNPTQPTGNTNNDSNDDSQDTEEQAPVIVDQKQANVIVQPFKANESDKQIEIKVTQATSKSTLIYYFDERYQAWIAVPTTKTISLLSANIPSGSWIAVMDDKNIFQPSDTSGNWANQDILKMMSLGIIQGFEDQSYKPQEPTNRYQIATVLAKALQLDPMKSDLSVLDHFPDAASIPEWAKPYVAAMLQNNLMSGSTTGFDGQSSLTRAQIATVLARLLADAKANPSSSGIPADFKDGAKIPAWAAAGVSKSVELGILQGYPDGSFQPNKAVTRAEMAAIITRLMDYLVQNQQNTGQQP